MIHKFETFGEEDQNESLNEAKKPEVKWVSMETRNFSFGAVYPIDMTDEEIRREAIMMAEVHIKTQTRPGDDLEFDAEYWRDIVNEELRIVEIPMGHWHREYQAFDWVEQA